MKEGKGQYSHQDTHGQKSVFHHFFDFPAFFGPATSSSNGMPEALGMVSGILPARMGWGKAAPRPLRDLAQSRYVGGTGLGTAKWAWPASGKRATPHKPMLTILLSSTYRYT